MTITPRTHCPICGHKMPVRPPRQPGRHRLSCKPACRRKKSRINTILRQEAQAA